MPNPTTHSMNLIPLLIKFYVSLVELLLFFSLAIILIRFVYYNDIHTHSLNQEDVRDMVEKFLEYVMTNHHVNGEPETILQAFQISLVRNVSLIWFFLGKKKIFLPLYLLLRHLFVFGSICHFLNEI